MHPAYRRISKPELPAKLAEFKHNMRATVLNVGGGLTVELISKDERAYEVRVIKRQSVCTVQDTFLISSR